MDPQPKASLTEGGGARSASEGVQNQLFCSKIVFSEEIARKRLPQSDSVTALRLGHNMPLAYLPNASCLKEGAPASGSS